MRSREQSTYLSYLIRLWRDGQQDPWRASLQSTSSGEVRRFGDLEAMWAFLQSQLGNGAGDPGSDRALADHIGSGAPD